ncbi:terpene synthase family protein [Amycolatopsis sp. cg5]|uniref:terpene synthase family protein n=1 Tax=Amycolatopsis sp. cg5 TaxID=3238802 RepID=UPI0035252A5C
MTTPRQVMLWFPHSWDTAPAADLLAAVGGQVQDWKRTATLIPSGYEDESLTPLAHGETFACHSYPAGRPDRLAVIARFLTLWTMDDDVSERWGISPEYSAGVLAALRGDDVGAVDPYLREWQALGHELRGSGLSDAWFRRLLSNFTTWHDHARLPEIGRKESCDQYWQRRPDGTGAVAWLDFLEYVHDRELTQEQHDTDYVRAVYVFAKQDYVVAFNDPTSVERDERRGVPNLCSLIAQEHRISHADAAARLAERHRAMARRRQAEIERARVDRPDLVWWLDLACVHHLGMARAHIPDPSRYGEQQNLPGSSFQVGVTVG